MQRLPLPQALRPVLAHEYQGLKLERPRNDFGISMEEWNVTILVVGVCLKRAQG